MKTGHYGFLAHPSSHFLCLFLFLVLLIRQIPFHSGSSTAGKSKIKLPVGDPLHHLNSLSLESILYCRLDPLVATVHLEWKAADEITLTS